MKENKFRVGDWVVWDRGKTSEVHQVIEVCLIKNHSALDNGINVHNEDLSLWKPKVGEWCWYSKWDNIVCLDYFLCKFVIGMNELEDGYTYKYEPFIGELPSFLKENK